MKKGEKIERIKNKNKIIFFLIFQHSATLPHIRHSPFRQHKNKDRVDVDSLTLNLVCGGLWWFVVVCGGLWWFVVFCSGLWWFVVFYGGLWWFVWFVVVFGGFGGFLEVYGGIWEFVPYSSSHSTPPKPPNTPQISKHPPNPQTPSPPPTTRQDLELSESMSGGMKSLLEELLRREVSERLGCRGGG